MLKDKSCYANENAYNRAYFLHKGLVNDYLIDPIVGSFIRVVTPHPDQPTSEKKWFNRPQFMIMTRRYQSRMFDPTDLEQLIPGVERIIDTIGRTGTFSIGTRQVRDLLTVNDEGLVMFKSHEGSYATLVSRISPPMLGGTPLYKHLTVDRYVRVITQLLETLKQAIAQEIPKESILTLPAEMMTTLHRYDAGVRTPIIITGRKFADRKENYITLSSGEQRLLFPSSETISAEDMIDKYMSNVGANCEILQGKPAGKGIVTMVMSEDDKINSLMEYVNCRVVPYDSGNQINVIMNSDRFPGNTKFSYWYERAFHAKFHNRLIDFARKFAELKA